MKKIPCEVYSRVVGYFRPVQHWNDGKRQEFSDRKTFSEHESMNSKVDLKDPETKTNC